ncbi:MAG: DUF1616 domain-containing protein [Dehalococcoidia bacterium]
MATILVVLIVPIVAPARIGLGLIFVLFVPGYVLVAALFPRKDDLDLVERLALSFGLSIAVVPLVGLALNYSPWGIRLNPILAFVTLFIVLAASVAVYRRSVLPSDEAMSVSVNLALPKWSQVRTTDRLLGLLLVLVLAVAGLAAYVAATSSGGSEEFTEFYVLGADGKAEGYPRTVRVGDKFTLILGVVNHEGEETTYRVQATIGGRLAANLDSLHLANKEEWEGPLALTATQPGSNQKVELVLYKVGNGVPCGTLHLWVDVEGSPPEAVVTEPLSRQEAAPSPTARVVQPGDALMSIGTVFGVHLTEIAADNDIANPNLLYPGQALIVPSTSP